MNRALSALAFALVLSVISCSGPASSECFVKNADCDAYGRYIFDLDMSDSLHTFSIDLYSAFTCRDEVFAGFTGVPVNVLWESPEGSVYEENVILPASGVSNVSHFGKSFSASYRKGVRPVVNGEWKLYLSVPRDSVRKYGMTGMGIKISKE